MKLVSPASTGLDPVVVAHIVEAQDWTNFFPSIRSGNTGVGMTFECQCRIPENNLPGADLRGAELKAKRLDSDSLLTLMTKNPPRAVRKLTQQFGTDTYDEDGALYRRRLYHTLKNGRSDLFELRDTDDSLELLSLETGEVLTAWTSKALSTGLNKLTNLCLIDANTRMVQGVEEFQYTGFTYYTGFNQQAFIDLLVAGEAFIDFRAHFCFVKNKMRDHGTAFRINPEKLADLYDDHTRVELVS